MCSKFYVKLDSLLDDIMSMLVDFIAKGNAILAGIGVSSCVRLINACGEGFSPETWHTISTLLTTTVRENMPNFR